LSRRAADTERLLPSALEQAVRKAKNVLRKARNEQSMWNGIASLSASLSASTHHQMNTSNNNQHQHHLAVAMPPLPWNVKNKGDKQRRAHHALAPSLQRPPRKYSNSSNGSQSVAPPPLPNGTSVSAISFEQQASMSSKIDSIETKTSSSSSSSSLSKPKIVSSPIFMGMTAPGIVKKGESSQSVNEPSSPSSPIAPPSPLLLSSGGQQDEPEFMALHDGIEAAFISIILTHINEVIRTRSGNK
jgi:hypothetical protein